MVQLVQGNGQQHRQSPALLPHPPGTEINDTDHRCMQVQLLGGDCVDAEEMRTENGLRIGVS